MCIRDRRRYGLVYSRFAAAGWSNDKILVLSYGSYCDRFIYYVELKPTMIKVGGGRMSRREALIGFEWLKRARSSLVCGSLVVVEIPLMDDIVEHYKSVIKSTMPNRSVESYIADRIWILLCDLSAEGCWFLSNYVPSVYDVEVLKYGKPAPSFIASTNSRLDAFKDFVTGYRMNVIRGLKESGLVDVKSAKTELLGVEEVDKIVFDMILKEDQRRWSSLWSALMIDAIINISSVLR